MTEPEFLCPSLSESEPKKNLKGFFLCSQRVFDASQFKMIHKKSEGRRPIFDREEIKVWRHDENLSDDPDFERRLVRVKSTSVTSKSSSDNISRMSPDVIR